MGFKKRYWSPAVGDIGTIVDRRPLFLNFKLIDLDKIASQRPCTGQRGIFSVSTRPLFSINGH